MSPSRGSRSLWSAPKNVVYRVLSSTQAPAELRGAGIRTGASIVSLERSLSGLIVAVNNTKVFMDAEVARLVVVEPEAAEK
jgi:hypothetical protein